MTTKRIRKKQAKRMAPGKQAQTRSRKPAAPLSGDEPDPNSWVTPGTAEGDRDTVEKDLASRDELND